VQDCDIRMRPCTGMCSGNEVMHSNLSDDPNEVLEQGLPPLVSDYSCSHIAQDVGTAGLDGIQVTRQRVGRGNI